MQIVVATPGDGSNILQGRRVLVLGVSPTINRSVVEPLRELGVAARGTTQPGWANERFNARDFELIVFGRGVIGATSARLKRHFLEQNPAIAFIDTIHPVAVRQTIAALKHDPLSPRFIDDFKFENEGDDARVRARILAPCHLSLTIYRIEDSSAGAAAGSLYEDLAIDTQAKAGVIDYPLDAPRLVGAHCLLLTANAQTPQEEFHLHPFSG